MTNKRIIRTCLHESGGPQIGDVKCSGSPHLSWKRDQITMRDYMDRRVTPPTRGKIIKNKQNNNLKYSKQRYV